jgi:4-hydroxy-4-methyl-2-oxoglutarate aldolase
LYTVCEVQPRKQELMTTPLTEADAASLRAAGTAVIADVFDSIARRPAVLLETIVPIAPDAGFVGPAFTVTGSSIPGTAAAETGDRRKLEAIDAMPAGAVPVWAGTDIRGVCCFGDLLSEAMKARGVAGIVVDGGVRDADYLRRMGLPIRARYTTPAQAIGRWKVDAYQVPVRVRGAIDDWVTVNPGDIVVADADGVVLVPEADLATVIETIREWAVTEERSRAAIQAGMPLLTAIERFGHL